MVDSWRLDRNMSVQSAKRVARGALTSHIDVNAPGDADPGGVPTSLPSKQLTFAGITHQRVESTT